MSIEIYNKAKIVKKGDTFYYFLKHHSKNDCICGGQVIVDDNFNDKYIRRDSRAGSWSVQAHGGEAERVSDKIADTFLNCPTSYIYGQVRFGNKKNIALYYAKQKDNYIDFENLSEMQKRNVSEKIEWYLKNERQCNLAEIPERMKTKEVHRYCDDKDIKLSEHSMTHNGRIYWNLDNL